MGRTRRARSSKGRAKPADLVVAIDDAGSFRQTSANDNLYVAAMVRPGKEDQYRMWERGIPESGRRDGEVKGGYLDENRLHDFVREVLVADPMVRLTPVVIKPAQQETERFKSDSVARLARLAEQLANTGRHDVAAQTRTLSKWISRMRVPHFLKLATMAECVAQSLSNAIGHAITGGFDHELPSLRYLVDRGLIDDSKEQRDLWLVMVAERVRNLRESQRLPLLDTWVSQGHAFLELYRREKMWDFDPLFKGRTAFVPSSRHYEVRIADITASIYRRWSESGRRELTSVWRRIQNNGVLAHQGEVTEIHLDPTPIPEP